MTIDWKDWRVIAGFIISVAFVTLCATSFFVDHITTLRIALALAAVSTVWVIVAMAPRSNETPRGSIGRGILGSILILTLPIVLTVIQRLDSDSRASFSAVQQVPATNSADDSHGIDNRVDVDLNSLATHEVFRTGMHLLFEAVICGIVTWGVVSLLRESL